MTKTQNRFGISNFGHCDLFDICDLLFGISDTPKQLAIFPGNPATGGTDLALRTRFSVVLYFIPLDVFKNTPQACDFAVPVWSPSRAKVACGHQKD